MPTNNQWFLMQEFQRASYFNWAIQMRSCSIEHKVDLGVTTDSLTVHHEGVIELHFHQTQWRELGERAMQHVKDDDGWLEKSIEKTVARVNNFLDFLGTIRNQNFKDTSDKQLCAWLTEYEQYRSDIHFYGVIGTILEFDHELFTKHLKEIIRTQIEKTGSDVVVNKVFGELTIFHEDTFVRKRNPAL